MAIGLFWTSLILLLLKYWKPSIAFLMITESYLLLKPRKLLKHIQISEYLPPRTPLKAMVEEKSYQKLSRTVSF